MSDFFIERREDIELIEINNWLTKVSSVKLGFLLPLMIYFVTSNTPKVTGHSLKGPISQNR